MFPKLVHTTATVAALLSSLPLAGCSVEATRPQAPTHAAANAATSRPTCSVTGAPAVLAKRVFVPNGVAASERDGQFEVRFGSRRSQCVAVEWPSLRRIPGEAACPAEGKQPVAKATSGDETMLAWGTPASDPSRIELGVVAYDPPAAGLLGFPMTQGAKLVTRTFDAPVTSGRASQTDPRLVPLGDDRFLLLWVSGGSEQHDLRAQPVAGWGAPVGPAMLLSPAEASVIGTASATVAASGDGLVAYVASVGDEFDVLGTPIHCAARGLGRDE